MILYLNAKYFGHVQITQSVAGSASDNILERNILRQALDKMYGRHNLFKYLHCNFVKMSFGSLRTNMTDDYTLKVMSANRLLWIQLTRVTKL